jgi:hypothetical protein
MSLCVVLRTPQNCRAYQEHKSVNWLKTLLSPCFLQVKLSVVLSWLLGADGSDVVLPRSRALPAGLPT